MEGLKVRYRSSKARLPLSSSHLSLCRLFSNTPNAGGKRGCRDRRTNRFAARPRCSMPFQSRFPGVVSLPAGKYWAIEQHPCSRTVQPYIISPSMSQNASILSLVRNHFVMFKEACKQWRKIFGMPGWKALSSPQVLEIFLPSLGRMKQRLILLLGF